MRAVPFTPALDLWLVLAMLPAVGLVRRRPAPDTWIWLLCFGGYFLVAFASGAGFTLYRTPHTFTPLVVLSGAVGVDTLASWLETRGARSGSTRSRAVVGGAMFVLCAFFLVQLRVTQRIPGLPPGITPEVLERALHPESLGALDDVLHGEAAASNRPWPMIAYTRSPSVSIPMDGNAAIESVIERYDLRWMVIFGKPPLWCGGDTCRLFQQMLAENGVDVGRFRLERVRLDESLPAVFRVVAARAAG